MLRETSAAPTFFASNDDTCLYKVPTRSRSASSSTGRLMAPGMWSSANSPGERTSTISSKAARSATVAGKLGSTFRGKRGGYDQVATIVTRPWPWLQNRVCQAAGFLGTDNDVLADGRLVSLQPG